MLVGIVLAIAAFLFAVIHFKATHHYIDYGFIVAVAGYVISSVLGIIWAKRFTRKHSEMEFIWDWFAAGGEVKDYPTDEKDQAEVEDIIYRMLLDRAMAADVAMQIRDRIKKVNSCRATSEYNRALNDQSLRADYLNQRYLSFWDLAVVKMGRFPEETDPRKFRESHSRKMYQ